MSAYYKLLKPFLMLILTASLTRSEQDTFSNVSAEPVAEYQKKAEQGNIAAQVLLGDCYDQGKGINQDYKKAAEWFIKAAEQGNAAAQYMLGNYYFSGKGVEENKRKAIDLYRKAAEQGFLEAEFMLGAYYAVGVTIPQDYSKAAEWYLKAAKRGHPAAQHQLGIFYKAGHAAQQDDKEALKWFRKSAEQGFAAGQFAYGVSVFTGKGTPKNMIEGYKWIYLAAQQNYETAKSTLTDLESLMSKQQISHAQESAKSFEPIEVTDTNEDVSRNVNDSLPPKATGTGFFITESGFLITNRHVVDGVSDVRLATNAGLISAKVVKIDRANDFALLKAEGEFSALPVTASRNVKLGAPVATVGFPNINMQGFSPKLSKGEVASLSGATDDPRYFQISVPVQPGNSGGALVDERGNVVGVVSAKLDAASALAMSGALPENVNYAVKSSFLLGFLESVPDAASEMKEPNIKDAPFESVVTSIERASVLVLVY
jgi:TPR repeat protein